MARVVLIGAGLTGISTAYHLEQAGFYDYAIFEKENEIGGLCRSTQQDGFTFDYTGHLLHASDPYFYGLIQKTVGLDTLNVINRRSFIYSHGTYTHYPFQINLHGLPSQVIVECIIEYVRRKKNNNPQTFIEWVRATFGDGFGKYFFFPFQEKIFAYDIHKITASWTGRFVPSTSLEQILYGSLNSQKTENVGYNSRFLYPQSGGIITWINRLAQQLHTPIKTNHRVTKVDMRTKTVTFDNGYVQPYHLLISTMPLDRLLGCLHQKTSMAVKQAQPHLKCNHVVNFNLGISEPNISNKHWIYFPEKKYPFYRLGFWHNFSPTMAPPGHSSLYGEFAYMNKSAEWVNQTLQNSLQATKQLFKLTPSMIVTEKIIPISHAYVTYDLWREKHLPTLLQRLEDENLYSIGRYGAWKYSSMQEAVLDGRKMADEVLHQLEKIEPAFKPKSKSNESQSTYK